MEAYQERVIQEKRELDEKYDKLSAFMHGETYSRLDPEDAALLAVQHKIMGAYSLILEKRIRQFEAGKSSAG